MTHPNPCPVCNVGPGESCIMVDGRVRTTHELRVRRLKRVTMGGFAVPIVVEARFNTRRCIVLLNYRRKSPMTLHRQRRLCPCWLHELERAAKMAIRQARSKT